MKEREKGTKERITVAIDSDTATKRSPAGPQQDPSRTPAGPQRDPSGRHLADRQRRTTLTPTR